MKMLSLKEIQLVSLDILKDVHSFCVDNNITYSLAYGTLIGAVRHQGFIPWDDDVDIMMPRPDYERFCKTFRCKGRGIVSDYDKNSFITFCKVFDTEKTICKNPAPYAKNLETGVCIDVFPLEGASDDFESFRNLFHSVYPLLRKQVRYRYAQASFKEIFRIFPLKDILILTAIKLSMTGERRIYSFNSLIKEKVTQFRFGSTHHWTQLANLEGWDIEYHDTDSFSSTVDMVFEGYSFKVLNGFDIFLKDFYGDYMKLPPLEERHPKHSRAAYYWK